MKNQKTIENLEKDFCLRLKTLWHLSLGVLYYGDLFLDLYTVYFFYKQSNYFYSILTLLFTLSAILINTFIRLKELYYRQMYLKKYKKSYNLKVFGYCVVNILQLYFLIE